MESIAGNFLVASRHLRDPNFLRTVVLIVQHDDEGALGVVLNRPSDKRISDIWHRTGHEPCDNPQPIFVGGPVPGPLMAVHTVENLAEAVIAPGVFFATHHDALDQLVRQETPLRLFSGHAGWGEGQLEAEMEVGGWLTSPANSSEVWSEPKEIWKAVNQRIGLQIAVPGLPSAQVPKDPTWN